MNTREEALEYGLSFPDTYRESPFHDQNWQLVRFRGNKKAFLWVYEKDGFINLNVKANTEKAYFWRHVYKSVIPGYHQNKDHWNTIILDGTVPDKDVKIMIAESYDLISDSPSKRIYEAVKRIPYGRVATYSQIAEEAGDRKMARAVGNALHKNPDPANIPCFRVVNAKGELAGEFAFGGAGQQAKLLRAEGVTVVDGKVDLDKYQWKNGSRFEIVALPKDKWKGTPIPLFTRSDSFYDLEMDPLDKDGCTIRIVRKPSGEEIVHTPEEYDFPDGLYQDHWEKAEAYGVVSDDGTLLACIEVCPEEWSNRLMVTELWVTDELQGQGIGKRLMDKAKEVARNQNRRAIILETQSCNTKAIGFYLHQGFELIGFDTCCYTNNDIGRREIRFNLGFFFHREGRR